jgi:hypothetical protein
MWFQTGTRWLGIGPVRGPRAFEDAPSDGKQYARQDASWAGRSARDLQNVLDNGRTAVINSSINLFDRVNGVPLLVQLFKIRNGVLQEYL